MDELRGVLRRDDRDRFFGSSRVLPRKSDREHTAARRGVFYPQPAAMELYDRLRNGEPQTETGAIATIERFEDQLPILLRDTGSRVGNGEHFFISNRLVTNRNASARWRVALRV